MVASVTPNISKTHSRSDRSGHPKPNGIQGPGPTIIWGVQSGGGFVSPQTQQGFIEEAARVLAASDRVFRRGDAIVFDVRVRQGRRLITLADGQKVDSCAAAHLAHLLAVGVQEEEKPPVQSLITPRLVNILLVSERLGQELPQIRTYGQRPVYDEQFRLWGPGWHEEAGILVHGPAVEPRPWSPAAPLAERALDRLPPRLRELLGEFPWASDADLTNAMALLVTGILTHSFVETGKPLGLIQANQPAAGKTYLADIMGKLLDDLAPPRIAKATDAELSKRLCAHVRTEQTGLILFDNLRGRLDSPLIEQLTCAPVLSFRIMKQSATVTVPNTYLWLITSNGLQPTPDLISRTVPVRLYFEGQADKRKFAGDPLRMVREQRLEILAELYGLVETWKAAGRPLGDQCHRCGIWAQVLGGILGVAGLPEFLTNVEDAANALDENLQALAALAAYACEHDLQDFCADAGESRPEVGRVPGAWRELFREVGVFATHQETRNEKGWATWAGSFLASQVDRQVAISTSRGNGTAILRRIAKRSNQKKYHFEIVMNDYCQVSVEPDPDEVNIGDTA